MQSVDLSPSCGGPAAAGEDAAGKRAVCPSPTSISRCIDSARRFVCPVTGHDGPLRVPRVPFVFSPTLLAPLTEAAVLLAGPLQCDQCRMRKIRCDRDWPCANCRISRDAELLHWCWPEAKGTSPARAHIFSIHIIWSERKIDRIEDHRLINIEALLGSLAAPADHAFNSFTPATGYSSSVLTAPSNADFESSDDEPALGSDTSLTAQTTFASEFLERAVKRTSLRETHPMIEAALENLRHLVEMQKRRSISYGPRFPLQKPVPPGGLCRLPMPPMSAVVSLLKQAKASPPTLANIMGSRWRSRLLCLLWTGVFCHRGRLTPPLPSSMPCITCF